MFTRILLVIATSSLFLPAAFGGYTLSLSPSSTSVAVGNSLTIGVSIAWDGTGSNGLATDGLISAGVGLRGSIPSLFQPLNTITDFVGNSDFDGGANVYNASSGAPFIGGANLLGGFAEGVFFDPALTTTGTTPINLGTFSFVAATTGTITITASRLDQQNGSNFLTLNSGVNLDGTVTSGSTRIQVTGTGALVPAPASLLLLVVGTVFETFRRRFFVGNARV